MAADICSQKTFDKCKTYVDWKRSIRGRLHHWAYAHHKQGTFVWRSFHYTYPPNWAQRVWFRTLVWISNVCVLNRVQLITPGEKIIVGMMLAGQYESTYMKALDDAEWAHLRG